MFTDSEDDFLNIFFIAYPVRTWCFKGKLSMEAPVAFSLVCCLGFKINFNRSKPSVPKPQKYLIPLTDTKGPRQVTCSLTTWLPPSHQPPSGMTDTQHLLSNLIEGDQCHRTVRSGSSSAEARKTKRKDGEGPLSQSKMWQSEEAPNASPSKHSCPSGNDPREATAKGEDVLVIKPTSLVTHISPTANQQ